MHYARSPSGLRQRCRLLLGTLALAALAALGGCGSEPFSFIPVSGKITYADGSLIPGDRIIVRLVPVQAQTVGKDTAGNATGYVDPKDGTFPGVTTHKYLDGVVPGRYKVVIMATAVGPQGERPTGAVPQAYQNAGTTPLEVEVTSSNRYFEWTIEKPR